MDVILHGRMEPNLLPGYHRAWAYNLLRFEEHW